MESTVLTIVASGNGVNSNTIVGMVYGALMLAIACTQLFLDYQRSRSTRGNGQ
ncbi:hypothetical protein GT037_007202 [Alternaria burnsii]|uniref:Uncharacterized protein n=1 Tax=Alternaria burnsii TaxID=1187904 RepID=A0A8H7EFZ3_9PLEO|nr:uncharacterized protein GT037_007202 [Alternaria burnsii]KAF7674442.1 hypothetical protein GT037_007202 [Alternaria burnsii]